MNKPMTKQEWLSFIEKTWDTAQREAWGETPRRDWVGLTDEERDYIWYTVGNSDAHGDVDGWSGRAVMDAIEAKLKEKNG